MGNELSSCSEAAKRRHARLRCSRIPLSSMENQTNVPVSEKDLSSKSIQKRTRDGTRKRSRTLLNQSQPAGNHLTLGSIGERWPITGVLEDTLFSQGNLELVPCSKDTDESVIYWRLDVGPYINSVTSKQSSGLPRLICSSVFRIHPVGSRLRWKLLIAPKDISDDSLSVYLENGNSRAGEVYRIESKFSLRIGSKTSCIPDDSHLIRHYFTSRQPVWGIQNAISFKDVLDLVEGDELTIGLQFNLYMSESVEQVCEKPKILMMEDFLTMDECEAAIEQAEPYLYRSRVASGTETPSRTSSSMFFTGKLEKFPIVQTINQKLLKFIQRPDVHEGRNIKPTESLQAVKYRIGEFYSEHYDNRAGYSELRAATLIVYLRDTEAGGATYFPKASRTLPKAGHVSGSELDKHALSSKGIRIYPRRGRALFFWSRLPNGEEDRDALHAAEAVIEGEKWIATRWLRELDE